MIIVIKVKLIMMMIIIIITINKINFIYYYINANNSIWNKIEIIIYDNNNTKINYDDDTK